MTIKKRLAAMERVKNAANPFCEIVVHFGALSPEGWSAGGITVAREAGESDGQLQERAAAAVHRHHRGDLAAIYKMLGELLPG
jgi:hypothetical protein